MREYLLKGLGKLNIKINDETIDKIIMYFDLLKKENEIINLTAIREDEAIIEKHFLDTFLLYPFLKDKKGTALDIGTGAGFPGMLLAITFPKINFTLMDSVGKKINFLEKVKNELNLENVELVNDRAEDFIKKDKRETYDFCFCRGVSKLNVILEYAIPFLKENASFLPQKMEVLEEINEAENALKVLNSKLIKVHNLELPFSLDKRVIIEIKKMEKTDLKYPRRTGIPLKKPL